MPCREFKEEYISNKMRKASSQKGPKNFKINFTSANLVTFFEKT